MFYICSNCLSQESMHLQIDNFKTIMQEFTPICTGLYIMYVYITFEAQIFIELEFQRFYFRILFHFPIHFGCIKKC